MSRREVSFYSRAAYPNPLEAPPLRTTRAIAISAQISNRAFLYGDVQPSVSQSHTRSIQTASTEGVTPMFAQITSRRFIHSVSRLRKLYRAGLVSIAVMLVLSFTVLTSAVSSGYLAMSDPSNNDSSSSTQAKSNPARYNTRLSMRFHTDEQNGTATVTTEKSDYQPGEYVTVTGAGWLPGEAVNLLFHQRLDEPSREDSTLTAIADAEGSSPATQSTQPCKTDRLASSDPTALPTPTRLHETGRDR
jgi:hypothetical protein